MGINFLFFIMAKKRREDRTWVEWFKKLKTWKKMGLVALFGLLVLVVYAMDTISPEQLRKIK